ncbi:MAG: 4Fe-4S binding protein [Desulfobacterales bacterium]|jgi:Pyruvate/2-oxoacid:ferredoxin oxidoreductase delta subunit|nr:4Fe-4S binding protein [Desulfobacterales bacterium]
MGEEGYIRLREFLDSLPGGYPATPSGVEIKILKKLFTPDQAELAVKLKVEAESVPHIAARTGMDEKALSEKLETMVKNGLIFRQFDGETPKYRAVHFIVGILEFQVNRMDKEFAELFEQFLPFLVMNKPTMLSDQLRVVPVNNAFNANSKIATYNRIRELIRDDDLIGVAQCVCRQEQKLLGNECRHPSETCLTFGTFARFYLDNGNARKITKNEALQILDRAEENGLVLEASNTQKLEYICCCCSCHCGVLKNIAQLPNPADFVTSYYQAVIDSDVCIGCGECLEICPMKAPYQDEADQYRVSKERCIGCGLCVPKCAVEAISMKLKKSEKEEPPQTLEQVFNQMLARQ